ncbi:MAG TPA: DUF5372 family protein [Dehalococcoidia bacterium]|nr:DUF5372 family protein [Dehalococcoidia bacterium]
MTHPFHPLFGCEFELVTRRKNWGEDRVFYVAPEGRTVSLPTSWTDVAPVDPFVQIAAGRCDFRYSDLVDLCRLLENDGGREMA